MRRRSFFFLAFSFFFSGSLLAQTCTINGSGTINWPSATCQEAGVNPTDANTDIIVPASVTLNIPNGGVFSHSGDITVYGTLINNKANALLNGSILVKSGAFFQLNAKMDLGSSAGCGYNLVIENGGSMTLNGSGGSDLLSICGIKIAQSGGSCTSCANNPPDCPLNGKPYCEPSGGFTGPAGYDQGGYNITLPIKLLYFRGYSSSMSATLEWATSNEENFDLFQLERSHDGKIFEEIAQIIGRGGVNTVTHYSHVDNHERSGRYYYRLKSKDLDGSFEYSKTITILIGEINDQLVIYPNPISEQKFKIKGLAGPAQLTLSDQLGRPLMGTYLSAADDEVTLERTIPTGLYFLKIEGVGFAKVLRLEIP
ncbi:MAG TPA: T9SS type A sorting domain-containing protein [Cyclobacteriaceae bacterium]|nr:T9SS type A sorting domain-containing protein [Cyclobacteriaceae bacterium]